MYLEATVVITARDGPCESPAELVAEFPPALRCTSVVLGSTFLPHTFEESHRVGHQVMSATRQQTQGVQHSRQDAGRVSAPAETEYKHMVARLPVIHEVAIRLLYLPSQPGTESEAAQFRNLPAYTV